jgi:hypothetical protein
MGTSISDLNKKDQPGYYDNVRSLQDMTQTNYGAGQNMHYEQGHNAAHQMHQAQQNPYYTMQNNNNYPQFNAPRTDGQYPGYLSQKQRQEMIDIEELAKDINDSLPENTVTSVTEPMDDQGSKGLNLMSSIPPMLREPLIILVLYIILSQALVKNTLSKYITQLNPDSDGKCSFTAVLIYGVILAVLFGIVKQIIM